VAQRVRRDRHAFQPGTPGERTGIAVSRLLTNSAGFVRGAW
jgi:hypothetical protein